MCSYVCEHLQQYLEVINKTKMTMNKEIFNEKQKHNSENYNCSRFQELYVNLMTNSYKKNS